MIKETKLKYMIIKIYKNVKYHKINKNSLLYIEELDDELFQDKRFSLLDNKESTLFKVTNDFELVKSSNCDYHIGYLVKEEKVINIIVSDMIPANTDINLAAELKRLKLALRFYQKYKCYRLTLIRVVYNFYKLILLPTMYLYNPAKSLYDEGVDRRKIRKIKGKAILISNHVNFKDGLIFIRRYFPETPFAPVVKEFYDKCGKFLAHYSRLAHILSLKDKSTIPDLVSALYANHKVAIFPEGKISNINEEIVIEEGTAYFAIKGHAIIYPSITLTEGKPFRRYYVIYGKPIDPSKYFKNDYRVDKDDVAELTLIIQNEMNRLMKVGRNRIKRKRY